MVNPKDDPCRLVLALNAYLHHYWIIPLVGAKKYIQRVLVAAGMNKGTI